MFNFQGGLFFKDKTLRKPLNTDNVMAELDQKSPIKEHGLGAQNSIVHFNSTFIEFIDRSRFFYGMATLTFVHGLIFISGTLLYFTFEVLLKSSITYKEIPYYLFIYIAFLPLLIWVISLLKKVVFTFSYFPVRFNRKNQKVYYMDSKKMVHVFDWHELEVKLYHYAQDVCEVRFFKLDDNNNVVQSFVLPHSATRFELDEVYAHWEFVRAYMEEGAEEPYANILDYYPYFYKKETIKEAFYRTLVMFRNPDKENNEHDFDAMRIYMKFFPIFLLHVLGRLIANLTNRLPRFDPDVEAECAVPADDPYDIYRNHKPRMKVQRFTMGEKLVLALNSILGIFISVFFLHIIFLLKGDSLLDRLIALF
ncbi:MAG: hypothetical protein EOO69_09670 [Moraxellaceae bacterium]|nr:MAG: hypothetical protein EOO69_09670 [Moraxellaceae bacterium]